MDMKTRKPSSVLPYSFDSELDWLPKKVIRVDDDIEVIASDISLHDCHDSSSWNCSLKSICNTNPEWLSDSSLVLAGSPSKRSNGALRKIFNISKSKTKVFQDKIKVPSPHKNSCKMVDNGMSLSSSPNVSPRKLAVVLHKTDTVENMCNLNSSDLFMLKKETDSSSELFLPKPFKIVKAICSDKESSQCNGFSNGHNTLPPSLQYCDNANSSRELTIFNEPQDTYFFHKEIKQEVTSDNEKNTSELKNVKNNLNLANGSLFFPHHLRNDRNLPDSDLENQSHSTSPSCSTNASISSLSDEQTDKRNNLMSSREMKQLFGSLNEIPWAQHWNPDTVLDEGRKPRQLKKRLSKPKISIKPSALAKKKAVKILSSKSPEKIQHDTKNTSSNVNLLNTRSSKKKVQSNLSSKPLTNAKSNIKNAKLPHLKVNSSVKKKTDSKRNFPIRLDFINSKPNEKTDSKGRHVVASQNKVLVSVNGSYKLNGGNKKANLPELKVKLEPVDAMERHQKETSDILKIGENWSKSKITLDTVVSYHMENILQRNLIFCLNGKNPDISDSECSKLKKPRKDDDGTRYSIRHTEGAYRYKEIAVKKHPGFIQIILVPNNNRQNGLAIEALIEIKEALVVASKDSSCKLVLLNSSGSVFCCGIDLGPLLGQDKIKAAEKTANAIQDLVKVLALFSKPIVAAVNGATVGFGVAILPFCDFVFASDKATFYTPYAKLGHIPEAALTLTLPQAVGTIISSDMLLRGYKLTAQEAKVHGLVSEVIWPTMLMEEVIPRVKKIINQPLGNMELTKMMLRSNQLDRLRFTLQNETRLLPKQWLSSICQKSIREVVKQGGYSIN